MKFRHCLLLIAAFAIYKLITASSWHFNPEPTGEVTIEESGKVVIHYTDTADLIRKLRSVPDGAGKSAEMIGKGIPCSSPDEVKAAYREKVDREMQEAEPEIDAEITRITGLRTMNHR